MKKSKYTFVFTYKDKYYTYNTLSNALLEIDKEIYNTLFSLSDNKNILSKNVFEAEIIDDLYRNNIITDSDKDDFLTYKSIMYKQRSQQTSMHLTLAPTMDCCFKCHYCFEKYKTKTYMSPQVMDSIIKYVQSFNSLKHINITWFGGEPLMAINQMEVFFD